MSIDNLLARLDNVKKTGAEKWRASCPAHEDKNPSLSIREMDDGRVLLHCFAGCGAVEVLNAIGLDFADLFPQAIKGDYIRKIPRAWNANDVLRALAFELLVAWNIAKSINRGEGLTDTNCDRLLQCASRFQRGLEVCNG